MRRTSDRPEIHPPSDRHRTRRRAEENLSINQWVLRRLLSDGRQQDPPFAGGQWALVDPVATGPYRPEHGQPGDAEPSVGDLAATSAFYRRLGFVEEYRDTGWLILTRDGATLEFFPFADLDPATSSFGCCLRLDDVDAFFQTCEAAGLPTTTRGWPRLHPPKVKESGLRIGALIDLDGTLLRLIANP